jgi:hypothetical protein
MTHDRASVPAASRQACKFDVSARTCCSNPGVRGRAGRGLIAMLDDDGVQRLAIEVLRLAVADLHGTHAARRRSAQNFVNRREDFEHWCAVAGVKPDAVRERLDHQEAA